MPDPSDIAVHGSIGWNCPGVLPVVNECFSDLQNFDWAGTSDTSAWVYHGAESQTEPAATYPSDNSFMGTPSFSNMSMDWAGNTSEASAIGDVQDDTIQLPLSPGKINFNIITDTETTVS